MAARKRARADLDLRNLSSVGPLLADHARRHYGTCASFCLRRSRPRGEIRLSVIKDGETTDDLRVAVHVITRAIRATLGDDDDAVEHGAYAVALLVAARHLGMRFEKRSYKGPGFDFYVTPPGAGRSDPDDIFGESWGFEVSGLMAGDRTAITRRLKRKCTQVEPATKVHPVLVGIVEFSAPVAIFELQEHQP